MVRSHQRGARDCEQQGTMEQDAWTRVAVNGAMLTVCSTECLDLLGRVRWIDYYGLFGFQWGDADFEVTS